MKLNKLDGVYSVLKNTPCLDCIFFKTYGKCVFYEDNIPLEIWNGKDCEKKVEKVIDDIDKIVNFEKPR